MAGFRGCRHAVPRNVSQRSTAEKCHEQTMPGGYPQYMAALQTAAAWATESWNRMVAWTPSSSREVVIVPGARAASRSILVLRGRISATNPRTPRLIAARTQAHVRPWRRHSGQREARPAATRSIGKKPPNDRHPAYSVGGHGAGTSGPRVRQLPHHISVAADGRRFPHSPPPSGLFQPETTITFGVDRTNSAAEALPGRSRRRAATCAEKW